jgi:hypothetical protein
MKTATLLLTSILAMLAGCQTATPPIAGMAALQLKIVAEPKTGAPSGDAYVSEYDTPAAPTDPFERVDYDVLDDIVVWLTTDGTDQLLTPPAAVDVDIDSANPATGLSCVASLGQKIVFHNRSSKAAEIYSVSDGNDFDLTSVPPGGTGQYTVRSPQLIEVLTDSQKDPVALIYAAPTPWVQLTHAGQTIEFNNLPPGQYTVHSWHPRLPGHETTVNLSANQIADASIKVGVNGLPTVEPR